MKYKLFTDGAARGNPGQAGLGIILFEDGKLIDFENKYIFHLTNNQAEYQALILGLKLAKKNFIKELTCFLDSELAVKQLNGEYKVKNSEIKKLKEIVDNEILNFEKVEFVHIPRKDNKFADKLANLAINCATK